MSQCMECSRAPMADESLLLGETTCGTLLQKLQEIWDEVGETDEERDKMLLQIEQECLDVYKKKVDQATNARSELLKSLSNAKIELANLLSALGEKTLVAMKETASGSIKEQLAAIAPELEGLLRLKEERVKEFSGVQSRIQMICRQISGEEKGDEMPVVDESDLSLRKLEMFQSQLQDLQNEMSERLRKVHEFVSTVRGLCDVLGVDFTAAVSAVHPSLNQSVSEQSTSISNETLSRLATTVVSLKEDKKQRLKKMQELATQLGDLWNLMDTSLKERGLFNYVTRNVSAEVDEVSLPGALAEEIIEKAEVEVERLDKLKASRMKEIAFKKQGELEEIYAQAHIEVDPDVAREKIMELIDGGNIEPVELLADMDHQIESAKEEALSRREILEKVEKWMAACEEESWLEDYNRDDNRYNASRGAHLNLKRAEKARILVNKIPSLVESLIAKTKAWEEERGIQFSYDGVPLLAMLDEYAMLRQEREEEKRRMRDQRKYQDQQGAEPSPRVGSTKRGVGAAANGANGTPRRQSIGANQIGSRSGRRDSKGRLSAPVNYVAISKDDSGNGVSGVDGVSVSP